MIAREIEVSLSFETISKIMIEELKYILETHEAEFRRGDPDTLFVNEDQIDFMNRLIAYHCLKNEWKND